MTTSECLPDELKKVVGIRGKEGYKINHHSAYTSRRVESQVRNPWRGAPKTAQASFQWRACLRACPPEKDARGCEPVDQEILQGGPQMKIATWNINRAAQAGLTLLCLTLVISLPVQAQTASTGTVLGLVKDPSGAIVPGVSVELIDTATQGVRTTVTNEVGRYTFTAVRPGTYSVTAAAAGFQKSVIPSLVVEISKSYTIDLQLKIGQANEQVVVTASAGAELQTLDATVGDTVGGQLLEARPSIDRNVTTLLLLQPSATPVEGEGTRSSRYGGQVAGGRATRTSTCSTAATSRPASRAIRITGTISTARRKVRFRLRWRASGNSASAPQTRSRASAEPAAARSCW